MIFLIRLLFIIGVSLYGYLVDYPGMSSVPFHPHWFGAGIGFLSGVLIVGLDVFFKQYTVKNILSILIGLALGLSLHKLFMMVVVYADLAVESMHQLGVVTALVFSYLGVVTILRGQDEFRMMIPFVTLDTKSTGEEFILIDTSVIIDARIADMCQTHFLAGKLILPRFVLKELQLISDSSDPLKRARGRRGLDVLNKMKNNPSIQVKINEMDFPDVPTVDAKLVKMAQALNAKIFTNDFNLNKVAELQGIKVLNINDLANALKPIVMPGEMMQVKVLKDGKEQDQGVAYLDDGTMVVVDNGRKRMGQTLNVIITSVLQTQAGRMIFARPGDEPDRGERTGERAAERERSRQDQRRPQAQGPESFQGGRGPK